MSWTQKVWSSRSLAAFAAVGVFGATAFYLGSLDTQVEASKSVEVAASAPSATFPANAGSLGPIPDRGATGCGAPAGPNRDVTFTVSGLSGAPTNVEVNMTFSPVHTWSGDVQAVLIAPNATSFPIFGRRGSTTATGCGSSSSLAGPYGFADTAAATNWFSVAGSPVPAGNYRSTTVGGVAGAGAVTSITPAFAGVADPNGTWTLRFNDFGGGDTGTVSAATLTIDAGAAPGGSPVADFDGDGRTDFAVVRQTNVPIAGQTRWFINPSSTGTVVGYDWGIGTTDFFTPADFDGDGKADIVTWRPGPPDVASFYILRSSDFSVQFEPFGIDGDNPTVVGDYDGDGKADPAVFRAPAGASDQAFFFYRGSLNNPSGNITFVPWGTGGNTSFPAVGDFDGDGKNDFVVQRSAGAGQGVFWMLKSGGGIEAVQFGLDTDFIIPADYDGDGKTDIATSRTVSGVRTWFVRPSATPGSPYQVPWGTSSSNDVRVLGDYDGDGKADFGIWRPATGVFWILNGQTFAVTTSQLGGTGDFAVASYQIN
jgi:hypothetical protein